MSPCRALTREARGARTRAQADSWKEAEIVNGRLAMWAFMGMVVGYQATGLGPVAALVKHLNVPQDNTIFDNSSRIDACIRTDLRCAGNNRLFMNTA